MSDKPDDIDHDQDFTEMDLDETSALLNSISFEGLDPTDFEEFCRDLLIDQGFVNVDWRKGPACQGELRPAVHSKSA